MRHGCSNSFVIFKVENLWKRDEERKSCRDFVLLNIFHQLNIAPEYYKRFSSNTNQIVWFETSCQWNVLIKYLRHS